MDEVHGEVRSRPCESKRRAKRKHRISSQLRALCATDPRTSCCRRGRFCAFDSALHAEVQAHRVTHLAHGLVGDAARDVAPPVLELARRVIAQHKDAESLLAILEGKAGRDTEALNRIFGEELPSGLVVAAE